MEKNSYWNCTRKKIVKKVEILFQCYISSHLQSLTFPELATFCNSHCASCQPFPPSAIGNIQLCFGTHISSDFVLSDLFIAFFQYTHFFIDSFLLFFQLDFFHYFYSLNFSRHTFHYFFTIYLQVHLFSLFFSPNFSGYTFFIIFSLFFSRYTFFHSFFTIFFEVHFFHYFFSLFFSGSIFFTILFHSFSNFKMVKKINLYEENSQNQSKTCIFLVRYIFFTILKFEKS